MISNGSPLPKAFFPSSSSSSSAAKDKGSDKSDMLVDKVPGGLKRVGGQGDILCGTVATLLAWGREWARGGYKSIGHVPEGKDEEELARHVALLAAYGASAFNRTVSRRGWETKRRAMVTHDLVELVGEVYQEMYGRYVDEKFNSEGKKGKL